MIDFEKLTWSILTACSPEPVKPSSNYEEEDDSDEGLEWWQK